MKKTVIFFGFLLFLSCIDNKQMDKGIENQILLKVGKEPKVEQTFRKHFELETILPIETTDKFLMTDNINRVLLYKDKLIILDGNIAIFVVDYATGKVESCIRRIGIGPGESRYIMDIAIDEGTETILAFNDYQRLLFYDFQGKFIKQEAFEKLYDNIIYDNGNVLFYNHGEGYSCYPYLIEKYNLQAKTWEKIGKEDRLDFPKRLYGRHIVKSKNIWFGTPLDFDLNLYKNLEIESKYRLSPATNSLNKDIMQLATSDIDKFFKVESEKNLMYGICSIRETKRYLLFISSGGTVFFIVDKTTNEIHWENDVKETSLNLTLSNYFPHDGDDNRIMFIVRPNEWIEGMNKASMDGISNTLKEKINSFKIEEDSNPILVFYKEI